MDIKKIAFFLAFFGLFWGAAGSANAADESRYLIKSNSTFWKNSFGIRHQFDGAFTADLSELELKMAKLFGLKIEPIKKLFILADAVLGDKTALKPASSLKSIDSIPWGIEFLYDNPLIDLTSGGKGVKVAVLDTGVLKTHPDLNSRISVCKDFLGSKEITDKKCDDENGHGTHVAGIIAADAGPELKGLYGVAPQANLLIYRVCDEDGSCWADDVAVAVKTAADDGANIINISLGTENDVELLKEAIDYAVGKNILIIAAAGNDGPDDGTLDFPAGYQSVIAVGAMDIGFNVPTWSSRGKNSKTKNGSIQEGDIEFVAPGINIESASNDGNYIFLSGTSLAAPHISGLAAKLWQFDSDNPDANIRAVLKRLTIDTEAVGEDNASGYGFPRL